MLRVKTSSITQSRKAVQIETGDVSAGVVIQAKPEVAVAGYSILCNLEIRTDIFKPAGTYRCKKKRREMRNQGPSVLSSWLQSVMSMFKRKDSLLCHLPLHLHKGPSTCFALPPDVLTDEPYGSRGRSWVGNVLAHDASTTRQATPSRTPQVSPTMRIQLKQFQVRQRWGSTVWALGRLRCHELNSSGSSL